MLNSMLLPILYFKREYLIAASAMILFSAFSSISFKMSTALMKLPLRDDIFWLPGRRTLPWVMWMVFSTRSGAYCSTDLRTTFM